MTNTEFRNTADLYRDDINNFIKSELEQIKNGTKPTYEIIVTEGLYDQRDHLTTAIADNIKGEWEDKGIKVEFYGRTSWGYDHIRLDASAYFGKAA